MPLSKLYGPSRSFACSAAFLFAPTIATFEHNPASVQRSENCPTPVQGKISHGHLNAKKAVEIVHSPERCSVLEGSRSRLRSLKLLADFDVTVQPLDYNRDIFLDAGDFQFDVTDDPGKPPKNAPNCDEGQEYRDADCEDCRVDIHWINEH